MRHVLFTYEDKHVFQLQLLHIREVPHAVINSVSALSEDYRCKQEEAYHNPGIIDKK